MQMKAFEEAIAFSALLFFAYLLTLQTHSYHGIQWVEASPFIVISFHSSPFDPLLSFVRHTSSPLFSAIIAWERSPLWYRLHAKSLSGKRVSKSAMCAVCWENKRAHTPVEDKQGFQRYDISIILAQDMNSSVILMVKGALHSGIVGAERHVLHMVNCLAAGIPRSATPPPPLTPFQAPVSSPGSNLQTQSSPAGSSPGCWVELNRILCSPSGLLLVPFTPTTTSTPTLHPITSVKWGCLPSPANTAANYFTKNLKRGLKNIPKTFTFR